MTTEEKKKELIELEWSFFQAVQNEGRRADCQNDPETFEYQCEKASSTHGMPP